MFITYLVSYNTRRFSFSIVILRIDMCTHAISLIRELLVKNTNLYKPLTVGKKSKK